MNNGCGAYSCAPARRAWSDEPTLRITGDELEQVVPLPTVRPRGDVVYTPVMPQPNTAGRSGLATASFVVALAGIPFFGVLTGLAAIGLGSAALGRLQNSRQSGTGLAIAGVLLGLFDVVAWAVFLSVVLFRPQQRISMAEFEPDQAAMEKLAPHIQRAMKANVVIESLPDLLGQRSIGSGVILSIENGRALIVTNRHVIDDEFLTTDAAADHELRFEEDFQITLIGQATQSGRVEWVAPDDIDLAIVSVSVLTDRAESALWNKDSSFTVGDEVFAVGNPQGLLWTHTSGDISQSRVQRKGSHRVGVIQTSTPINPGNSGGGLYNSEGTLIGINTWTNDKRVSEGISFAIALRTLLDIVPAELLTAPEASPAIDEAKSPMDVEAPMDSETPTGAAS